MPSPQAIFSVFYNPIYSICVYSLVEVLVIPTLVFLSSENSSSHSSGGLHEQVPKLSGKAVQSGAGTGQIPVLVFFLSISIPLQAEKTINN